MTSFPPNNVKFQIDLFKRQIYSTLLITLGGVFFGLGIVLVSTYQIIMMTEDYTINLGNFVNSLFINGILFSILGIIFLLAGITLPHHWVQKYTK